MELAKLGRIVGIHERRWRQQPRGAWAPALVLESPDGPGRLLGDGTKFAAMACMDISGKDKAGDTWSYPGKGFFPLKYLHGDGRSFYLREGPPSRNALEVEVFRLAARPQKPFIWADKEPGEKLEIARISSKMNAINFEPKGVNKEGIYWVRIRGVGVRERYLVEL